MTPRIFIGFDPRERDAFAVADSSLLRHATFPIDIDALVLPDLQERGLYTRPIVQRDGRLFDPISDAPMSTEFALSRFLVPTIAGTTGWALFMDCDMLARADIGSLFALADPRYAVQVVKHAAETAYSGPAVKMDGQVQTIYRRKNWSSVMLFNLAHPGLARLTVELVNAAPGRDLHGFNWLADDLIGELPPTWNHLVGVDPHDPLASLVHFTLGVPSMPGYENSEFADEWRAYL